VSANTLMKICSAYRHSALTSVAVHWCWVTEHLYEQQVSIGVIAGPQANCEPLLQSTTEHWGMHSALTTGVGALHTCMNSKCPHV